MSSCIERLNEARNALHRILTGRVKVRISDDRTSVEYSQANVGDLRAYISELVGECGEPDDTGGKRGPPFEVMW